MKNKKLTLFLGLVACWLPLQGEVLSFSKAYELALANAHNIKASTYNMEAEKEKINQESARLFPSVDLSAYYKKSEYEHNPTERITRQGLINYGVSLQQPVYNPEIVARIDVQEARSQHSLIALELEKKELAQELFSTYLELLKSKNRIDLLEAYLQYNIIKLQELEKRYEMHLCNKMDLLEMRVEKDTSQIELQKERRLFEVHRLKFQNFIGDYTFELPHVTTRERVMATVKLMQSKITPELNLNESLYIQKALASVEISKNEYEYAKDGHMPKLTFDASYSMYETDDPMIDSQFKSVKYVMLNLNLPLYEGGATSSRIESSRLLQQVAYENMQNTKNEIQVKHDEFKARFDTSAESVWIYNDAYTSAELYVDAIEQGYAHGLKSLTDLNDAKNKFYKVKFNYIENIYELVNSYIGICIIKDDFTDLELLDKLIEN